MKMQSQTDLSYNITVTNDNALKQPRQEDILDLAGELKPSKNQDKSVLQAREVMEKEYQRY